MAKGLFYTFSVGEDEMKEIQIDRLNPEQVFSLIVKLKDFDKIKEPGVFVRNNILKNIKVDLQDFDPDEFEVYEYIDLLGEAINLQLGLESLGKSKILKRLGIDMNKIKANIQTGVMKMSLKQKEN